MRTGWSVSALLCSLIVSCHSPERIYLERTVPPGGVGLYAVVSPEGIVEHVGRFSKDGPSEAAAPQDATVVAWLIDAGSILDPSGDRLSEEALRDLIFHRAADAEYSCGRCLVPPHGDRWILHPGSGCPVPPGIVPAVQRVEGAALVPGQIDDVSAIAAQVRLSRPGNCACGSELPQRGSTESLLVCPITPEEGAWPVTGSGLVLAPGGWVGMFSKHRAAVIDPDGGLHESRDFSPFVTGLMAAVSLPTPAGRARFLVMDRLKAADSRPARIFQWDNAGRHEFEEWPGFDPRLRVSGARWTHDGDRLLVFGRDEDGWPAVNEISAAELVTNQAPDFGPHQGVNEGCDKDVEDFSLNDVVYTSSGTAVGVTTNGYFTFRSFPEVEWECQSRFTGREVPAREEPAPQFFQLESKGSWVYACGGARDEKTLFGFDTAPLLTGAGQALQIVPFDEWLAAGCAWIASTPDGRLLAADAAGHVIELVGGTAIEQASLGAALGAAQEIDTLLPLDHYVSTTDGHELVASVSATALWTRSDGPPSSFIFRHGPSSPPPAGPYVLGPAPSGRPHGAAVLFRGEQASPLAIDDLGTGDTCERFVTEPIRFSGIGPVPNGEQADVAVPIDEARYVLFTSSSTVGSKARWLDLDAGQGELELALPSQLGPVVAAGELNARTLIVFGQTGSVIAIANAREPREAQLVSVTPVWDDPRSEAIEGRPGEFEWTGFEVSEGIGWAHGKNVLARVLPGGDGQVRIEAYWLSHASLGRFGDPAVIRRVEGALPVVSAIQLGCPDSALFVTDEIEGDASENLTTKRIYSWQLGPESSCAGTSAGLTSGDLEICDTPFFSKFRFTEDASDGVRALFPTSTGLLNVLGEGTIRGDGSVYPLPSRVRSSHHDPRSRLLFYNQARSSDETVERVGVVAEIQ